MLWHHMNLMLTQYQNKSLTDIHNTVFIPLIKQPIKEQGQLHVCLRYWVLKWKGMWKIWFLFSDILAIHSILMVIDWYVAVVVVLIL